MTAVLWAWPLLCYLMGSLSFAYLAGKWNGVDLRQQGSKNLGATNAGRVLGEKWFFIVFTLDLAKGVIAVVVAQMASMWLGLPLSQNQLIAYQFAAAAAVVLGHSFTCFHGFRGGKAVATSLGVIFVLAPKVAGIASLVWILVWVIGWIGFRAKKSNAVGPASVAAAIALPIIHIYRATLPWRMPELAMTVFLLALSALILVRHRSNIRRLFVKEQKA